MTLSPAVMHFLLVACLVGLAVIAVFYLRGRQLSYWGYLGWGLVAILIPLVGPFIVLLARPGKKRQAPLQPQEGAQQNRSENPYPD